MWQSHKSHCVFRSIGEKLHTPEFVDILLLSGSMTPESEFERFFFGFFQIEKNVC